MRLEERGSWEPGPTSAQKETWEGSGPRSQGHCEGSWGLRREAKQRWGLVGAAERGLEERLTSPRSGQDGWLFLWRERHPVATGLRIETEKDDSALRRACELRVAKDDLAGSTQNFKKRTSVREKDASESRAALFPVCSAGVLGCRPSAGTENLRSSRKLLLKTSPQGQAFRAAVLVCAWRAEALPAPHTLSAGSGGGGGP